MRPRFILVAGGARGTEQVNKLDITSDKQLLAAAGNPLIKLFEVNSNNPQPILTYEGHTANVTAVNPSLGTHASILPVEFRLQLQLNMTIDP